MTNATSVFFVQKSLVLKTKYSANSLLLICIQYFLPLSFFFLSLIYFRTTLSPPAPFQGGLPIM